MVVNMNKQEKISEIEKQLEKKDYSKQKKMDRLLGISLLALSYYLYTTTGEVGILAFISIIVGILYLYISFFADYTKIAKFLLKLFYKPLAWIGRKEEKALNRNQRRYQQKMNKK